MYAKLELNLKTKINVNWSWKLNIINLNLELTKTINSNLKVQINTWTDNKPLRSCHSCGHAFKSAICVALTNGIVDEGENSENLFWRADWMLSMKAIFIWLKCWKPVLHNLVPSYWSCSFLRLGPALKYISIKLLTLNLRINNICNYWKTTKEQTLFYSSKRLQERLPGNHADMILMQSCPGGSVIDDAKVQGHPAKKAWIQQ